MRDKIIKSYCQVAKKLKHYPTYNELMDDLNKLEDNENVEDKDNSKFEEFLI